MLTFCTKHSAGFCGFELHGYVMCSTSGSFTFVEEQVEVADLFDQVEAFCQVQCVASLVILYCDFKVVKEIIFNQERRITKCE